MTGWSHGYNVSQGYTFGFYREMAPDWLDLAIAVKGLEPPRSRAGGVFRYLELGSGQGFGLCLLAASNPEGEFLGIDFSPEHIAHATRLATDLGLSNIRFVEGDFAALGEHWPQAYGQFDYVALHGIYSWVPKAIREALIAILRESVAPGGAVYVSYNSMPGWTSTLPFQHILRRLERGSAKKGMNAIEAGRDLFAKLEEVGSGITKALPALKSRIENTRKQPAAYLVQEYLHENWHPLWSSQVLTELAEAKLAPAASATMAENLLPALLPGKYRELLAEHEDPALREDLTDCLINQTFRRDIFVRGARKRFAGQAGWRDDYRFWRTNQGPIPSEIAVTTGFGTVKLGANVVSPLLEALADGPLSLTQIAARPDFGKDFAAVQQNLLLLVQASWLGCGRGEKVEREPAMRCNAALARLASVRAPYRHLAAPHLGSAVPAGDSELLMLECYLEKAGEFEAKPEVCLKERLSQLGRKMAKNGKALTGDEEAAQIAETAQTFVTRTLPLWKRLGVID